MLFHNYYNWRFDTEIERAGLLIHRLNDEDVASSIARTAAVNVSSFRSANSRTGRLHALMWAYAAYAVFSEFVIRNGECSELNEHWLASVDSLNRHIWDRCWPNLKPSERLVFEYSCPIMYRVVHEILSGKMSGDQLDIESVLLAAEKEMEIK